jgi:hypothetical protein
VNVTSGFQAGAGLVTITYTPPPAIAPTALTFASQQVGTASPAQAIVVGNVAATPFSAGAVALTGLDADQFKIAYNGCSGQTLATGATCSVSIRYLPIAAGAASASLQITSDAVSSPDSVSLSGTAIAPSPPPQGPQGPAGPRVPPARWGLRVHRAPPGKRGHKGRAVRRARPGQPAPKGRPVRPAPPHRKW